MSVDEISRLFPHLKVRDRTVGTRLSGGEQQMLAMARILRTGADFILLDEPTSGLDSFKALQIVKLLRSLARQGKTVISTIHQPSSEAFNMFDRLLLMADGHCVYQGEAGRSAEYFRRIGFRVPTFANPSDVFMRVLSVRYPKSEKDERKLAFLSSMYEQTLAPLEAQTSKAVSLKEPNLEQLQTQSAGICGQMPCLLRRSFIGVDLGQQLDRQGSRRRAGHSG